MFYGIHIHGRDSTGRFVTYTPREFKKEARAAVKGKGKLSAYWLESFDGGNVRLVAQYVMRDGWPQTVTHAI